MRGDFSRFTHRPEKHYSGVIKQQGRIDLDSEWNENTAIRHHRSRQALRDIIGPCGAPIDGGGFEISRLGRADDFAISAGRIYVDGILCALERRASYLRQPDFPNPPGLHPQAGRTDLVYLDVWERIIDWLEDSDILDEALGSAGSNLRLGVVQQVKVIGGIAREGLDNFGRWLPGPGDARLTTKPLPVDPDVLAPVRDYQGLENRLYRLEIHRGGDAGGEPDMRPTFKWSRENGSVRFAIDSFPDLRRVSLVDPGKDAVLALVEGDWVEVIGRETVLKEKPGTIARIESVDPSRLALHLSEDVSDHASEKQPVVIRWDQGGPPAAVETGKLLPLEDGIGIEWTGRDFRSGDYWTIAVRAGTGSIKKLDSSLAHGIEHHYCPLALLTWDEDGCSFQDVRKRFYSLTELTKWLGPSPLHGMGNRRAEP
jgi:hypothetical protein